DRQSTRHRRAHHFAVRERGADRAGRGDGRRPAAGTAALPTGSSPRPPMGEGRVGRCKHGPEGREGEKVSGNGRSRTITSDKLQHALVGIAPVTVRSGEIPAGGGKEAADRL